MKTLYPHQLEKSKESLKILRDHLLVYICAEVRTGKTGTSLNVCKLYGASKILFITKKKAISSIHNDISDFGFTDFAALVINYESVHLIPADFNPDVIILDESHSLGQYPKPGIIQKKVREICKGKPIIFLSGTPSPETYVQLFHQLQCSEFSPWREYTNFYKWFHDYGITRIKMINSMPIKIYTHCHENKVMSYIAPFMVKLTQQESGFESPVIEHIRLVSMNASTYNLASKIIKDKVYYSANKKVILADTAAKELQKIHQIYSGTIKFQDGTRKVFDDSKIKYIFDHFKDQKIAIFYKFIAELEAIQKYFTNTTSNPEEFKKTDKVFVCQFQSGREGIDLSAADCLVMYNIDFSATSYWQVRARLQNKERTKPANIYWIFSDGGIETDIYDKVMQKKNYTTSHYKKNILSNK